MTSVDATHPAPLLTAPRAHARFARRIQAAAIDVLIHGTTLIALMSVLDLLRGHRPVIGAAFAGWLGFAFLYEPLLVSRRGATVGHALLNLRVVDAETGGPPEPVRAFARFWLKATSGLVALVLMAVTRQPQALHDLAVGTRMEEGAPIALIGREHG